MKRFGILIPVIAALSACSVPIPKMLAPSLDIYFSAEAKVSYGGCDCSVQMRRINNDKWEFCVTDPYPLEGLVISLDGNNTKLAMFDMQSKADVSAEAVSAAKLISAAFEAAAERSDTSEIVSENGSEDGTAYVLTGQCTYGTYTIRMNEDMQPVALNISDHGVSADITKFVPLEKGDNEEAAIVE